MTENLHIAPAHAGSDVIGGVDPLVCFDSADQRLSGPLDNRKKFIGAARLTNSLRGERHRNPPRPDILLRCSTEAVRFPLLAIGTDNMHQANRRYDPFERRVRVVGDQRSRRRVYDGLLPQTASNGDKSTRCVLGQADARALGAVFTRSPSEPHWTRPALPALGPRLLSPCANVGCSEPTEEGRAQFMPNDIQTVIYVDRGETP